MVGSWLEKLLPRAGDLGPIWISVGGGGLGSLGELGGIDISVASWSKLASYISWTHATRTGGG
jgi:hypothetical protein